MEELQELVDTAKQAVPGVDEAIAAAIDRKLNPVSHSACKLAARPALGLYMLVALFIRLPSGHAQSAQPCTKQQCASFAPHPVYAVHFSSFITFASCCCFVIIAFCT